MTTTTETAARKPTKSLAMAATRRGAPAPVAPARKVRVVADYCERVRLRDRWMTANRHLSSPSEATRAWAQREVALAAAKLGW